MLLTGRTRVAMTALTELSDRVDGCYLWAFAALSASPGAPNVLRALLHWVGTGESGR
jgi:hypothetical protein